MNQRAAAATVYLLALFRQTCGSCCLRSAIHAIGHAAHAHTHVLQAFGDMCYRQLATCATGLYPRTHVLHMMHMCCRPLAKRPRPALGLLLGLFRQTCGSSWMPPQCRRWRRLCLQQQCSTGETACGCEFAAAGARCWRQYGQHCCCCCCYPLAQGSVALLLLPCACTVATVSTCLLLTITMYHR